MQVQTDVSWGFMAKETKVVQNLDKNTKKTNTDRVQTSDIFEWIRG